MGQEKFPTTDWLYLITITTCVCSILWFTVDLLCRILFLQIRILFYIDFIIIWREMHAANKLALGAGTLSNILIWSSKTNLLIKWFRTNLESFFGFVISSSSSFIGKFMNAELVGAKTVQGPASNKICYPSTLFGPRPRPRPRDIYSSTLLLEQISSDKEWLWQIIFLLLRKVNEF